MKRTVRTLRDMSTYIDSSLSFTSTSAFLACTARDYAGCFVQAASGPTADQPTPPERVGSAPQIPQPISQTVTPTLREQARKVVADVGDGVDALAAPDDSFGRLILLPILGQDLISTNARRISSAVARSISATAGSSACISTPSQER